MTQDKISQNSKLFHSLPLRDLVMFPNAAATILVGRRKSINCIKVAQQDSLPIFAVAQRDHAKEEFNEDSLYEIGTLCRIVESTKTIDGNVRVVIQGFKTAKIKKIIEDSDFFFCEVEEIEDVIKEKDLELEVLIKECVKIFAEYAKFNKKVTPEIIKSVASLSSVYEMSYVILAFLSCETKLKQKVLEENDPVKKLFKVFEIVRHEVEILKTEAEIALSIQKKINKSQKDLYLNEQLKYINKELGNEDNEIADLKKQLAKAKMPKLVKEKCEKEISKFEKANPMSSEAGVLRNYIDLVLSLPWNETTKPNQDLEKAKKILDDDHYGLDKIKDRILELIAVQVKTKSVKGPIICFVGPPGVGKTSLAKSIAKSVNRTYCKVSLGGVKDESEIRGHRRTYIGALPGRIINSMKKAKVINPLMLLDEIDKMSHDLRGDPASAMLEVLDPEQNNAFNDHYLELDYDLSKVMFIATANSAAGIPAPLRDRMEIIKLSGYSENEKLEIAKLHLVPKQRKEAGLTAKELKISDKAILSLIRNYTFEAGVRNLEREIAKIARKTVKNIIMKKVKSVEVDEADLAEFNGPQKFDYGIAKKDSLIGVATGLSYSELGGDLLDIEAVKFNGKGKIQTTGKLGEVMNESAKIALSYVRSVVHKLKVSEAQYNKYDFHLHFPEGATPKDGPSAGVAICLALASSISKMPVNKNVAVTGEVTLNGNVLPIGGLKEKLLAALRGGITKALIPVKNTKDLVDMPQEILNNLEIKPISTVEEAFCEALVGYKSPKEKSTNKMKNKTSLSKVNNNSIVIESDIVT